MKYNVSWVVSLFISMVSIWSPGSAVGGIDTVYNYVYAEVHSAAAGDGFDEFQGISIDPVDYFPTHHLLKAKATPFQTKIKLDYERSTHDASVTMDVSQKRGGLNGDYCYCFSDFAFSVDVDTTYNLSGEFNVRDGASAGNVFLTCYLYEFESGDHLFVNVQESASTTNERFVLGETGGDTDNYSFGSLSGRLIAGHHYQFYCEAYVLAGSDERKGSSAEGEFQLNLKDACVRGQ